MLNPTPDTARPTIHGLAGQIIALTVKHDNEFDTERALLQAEEKANELLISIRRVIDHMQDQKHGYGPTLEAAG